MVKIVESYQGNGAPEWMRSAVALVEQRTAKVDYWKNSDQQQRWLATALLDIEPRLRRVKGYRLSPRCGARYRPGAPTRTPSEIGKRHDQITRSATRFQLTMTLTRG